MLLSVTRRSIHYSLLFKISLSDLFLMSETEFASYADINTSCTSTHNIDDFIKPLENDL